MKKHRTGLTIKMLTLGMVMLLAACSGKPSRFSEGKQYIDYSDALAGLTQSRPELASADVIEFFTYGCSHCRHFAPELAKWHRQHPQRHLVYVPVVWNSMTKMTARLFYFIRNKPHFATLHHELFELVGSFTTSDSRDDQVNKIVAFLQKKGLQPEAVKRALTTSEYDSLAQVSLTLAKHLDVDSTPTVIVNKPQAHQQYRIVNETLNNYDELLQLTDFLLASKPS